MIDLVSSDADQCETVFHKKLKIKLKEKGKTGRIDLLKDYLEFTINTNRTLAPDFPAFVREVMGLDDRAGWIHFSVWHESSELAEFAASMGYEHRVEHYD